MSSSSKTNGARRAIAAALAAGAILGGCSDIYYDRRETVALGGPDAVESNKVVHMVDPWPRYSANNNIAFNGERMQSAVERYRQNKVTPPVNATTSSVAYQQAQAAAAAATANQQSSAPAPPVR